MEWYGLSPAEHADLEREVLELFTAILRVDTTNPPGNETACALVLKDYLAANGIESELAGELPDRQNLVAVVEGTRPGPTLLYMGHTDVVPADAAEWTVPPFSGTVRDGYVWGCGTMDMKNQVAAEAVAVARLARSGTDFAGRLRFAATCDEEDGTHCGVLWLCRNRPDLVRCDYSVNEGMGGLVLPIDGHPVMLLAVGEKAFAQFTVRTRGLGGHGSVPSVSAAPCSTWRGRCRRWVPPTLRRSCRRRRRASSTPSSPTRRWRRCSRTRSRRAPRRTSCAPRTPPSPRSSSPCSAPPSRPPSSGRAARST
ncbi:MAG: M20/M25/M40 family metallo-hydrolase [Actinomycetota bacterium]|nr:MAG: M20/M25/M40 family metallo-hydrolase [Actinomycetota bacterium]